MATDLSRETVVAAGRVSELYRDGGGSTEFVIKCKRPPGLDEGIRAGDAVVVVRLDDVNLIRLVSDITERRQAALLAEAAAQEQDAARFDDEEPECIERRQEDADE